ncbi:hypothetical protein K438DRAFT_1944164 [Mycena galopus ATCC 62051]|nr:hypothetical protein K438DRAFT_1944164 [Mycena galopus ATCC 62051]
MAPLSDAEDSVTLIPARETRARKRQKDEISESETSDIPARKPARKRPGPKPKPATTAKAPKKKPAPTSKTKDLGTDSDSDIEEVIKPKAKKKPKKTIDYGSDGDEVVTAIAIIFMIPEAGSEGNQRVSLLSSHSFEDAVEIIYETIGCVSVARKPTLAYKLSSAGQKSAPINLRTSKDWDGLITDYGTKVKSKKDLSIMLTVLPDSYMFSLRSMTKKAPAAKKAGKKGKMTTLDLENDDTDVDGEGDDGVEDGEKLVMAELDAQYRNCVRCGTAHLCKIDRAGNHVHLTFPQRRAWSVSLACGTHKVTTMTPPLGGLFAMFHNTNTAIDGPPPPPQMAYHQPPYYHLPSVQPGSYGYPPPPPPPHVPHFPPAPAHQPMMSSDPIEEDDISYPSVIDFIDILIISATAFAMSARLWTSSISFRSTRSRHLLLKSWEQRSLGTLSWVTPSIY